MDIRELRINSTVWFNDKRVKITAIDNTDDVPFVKTSFRDDKWLHAKLIDPIPITEELLKELGFGVTGRYSNEFIRYIDKFGLFVKHINGTNRYRLTIEDEDGIAYGNILCRYLSDMETFVYLTTKKELI